MISKNPQKQKPYFKNYKNPDDKEKAIFVGGFSCSTSQNNLFHIFSKFGPIKKIKMAQNKKGGSKGYCFITFYHKESAKRAINHGDLFFKGRKMNCRPILTGDALKNFKKRVDEKRISVTNFTETPGVEDKALLRELFENFGKIENFYFAKENIDLNKKELTLFITYSERRSVELSLKQVIDFNGRRLSIKEYNRIELKKSQAPNQQNRSKNSKNDEEYNPYVRKVVSLEDSRRKKLRLIHLEKEQNLIKNVWSKLKNLQLILHVSEYVNHGESNLKHRRSDWQATALKKRKLEVWSNSLDQYGHLEVYSVNMPFSDYTYFDDGDLY